MMQATAIRPLRKHNFRHPDDVDAELEGVVAPAVSGQAPNGHALCHGDRFADALETLNALHTQGRGARNPLIVLTDKPSRIRPLTAEETVMALVEEFNHEDWRMEDRIRFFEGSIVTCSGVTYIPTTKQVIVEPCSETLCEISYGHRAKVITQGNYKGEPIPVDNTELILRTLIPDKSLLEAYVNIQQEVKPTWSAKPTVVIPQLVKGIPYHMPIALKGGESLQLFCHDMRRETYMLYRK